MILCFGGWRDISIGTRERGKEFGVTEVDRTSPAVNFLQNGHGRWFPWTPVCLGLGIATYFALPIEPPIWWGASGVVFWLTLLVALRRFPIVRLGGLALFAVTLGFTLAQVRTHGVVAPVIGQRIGPATVDGRIVAVEMLTKGQRIILDRLTVSRLSVQTIPERIRLRVNGSQPDLRPGVWVRGRAVLTPPPPPVAPGAYDFQRQAFFQRIGGVGFVLGPLEVTGADPPTPFDGFRMWVEGARQDIAIRVSANLEDSHGTAAVAAALMTGLRGKIPEAVMTAMRDAGLAHLLAISGLHVGLVAALIFAAVRALLALIPWLALRYPIKKWAAVIAITGAGAYAVIAGGTVPTQRAFLMVGLVFVAVLRDRRAISMRLVAFAAMVVLAFSPESLLGASFQMSFAAATALVAIYEHAHRWQAGARLGGRGWRNRLLFYFAGVLVTTVVAGLATAPFAVFHFNRFALYGVAANLVAVPLTALWIMPWGMVAFAALPLGLENVPLAMMGAGIDAFVVVANVVSGWPGAVGMLPAFPAWALGGVVLGGLWLCLWPSRERWAGLVGVIPMAAALWMFPPPDVFVDDTGKLFAVRTTSGDYLPSTRRSGRFDREIWLRRAAATESPGVDNDNAAPRVRRLLCDGLGCVYRIADRTLAFAKSEEALNEDCWRADVLVVTVPIRAVCGNPAVVLTRRDLARDGAHAIWLNRGGIRVRSVNGERGDRPWVVRPGFGNGGT